MEFFFISLVVSLFVTWVVLALAMLLVSRIADIAFPPLPDFLWKTAVVVVASNVLAFPAFLLSFILGYIVGIIAFFGLMVKLLDLDLWQTVVIVIGVWVVRFLIFLALGGLLAAR
jgi:hypothetical protein